MCDNIEIATHTAYNLDKRYRVVTKNGELIELSGTMSGGGQPKQGGMSAKLIEEFTENQIHEEENDVRRKNESLNDFRKEQEGVRNDMNSIQKKLMDIQRLKQKSNVEVQSFEEFNRDLDKKIKKMITEQTSF